MNRDPDNDADAFLEHTKEQQMEHNRNGRDGMKLGQFVVVRTYSAGVHVGTLAKRDGKEVTLTDARRIWSWKGANTLHEISLSGVGKGSRISETAPEVFLTEAIEIIAASDAARASLMAAGWSK